MTPINIKIMKTQPTISDEEIRSLMNFDGLLSQQQKDLAKRRVRNRNLKITGGAASLALLILLFYILPPQNPTTQTPIDAPNKNAITPVLSKDSITSTETETKSNVSIPQSTDKKQITKAAPPETTRKTNDTPEPTPVDSTYHEAEPVDGFPALYEYFNRELKYPSVAEKDSIQGIVTVSFVLTKEGKPVEVKTSNSLGGAFDQEAMRLIESMPPWKPAKMNGRPVASKISLPLTFHFKMVKPH